MSYPSGNLNLFEAQQACDRHEKRSNWFKLVYRTYPRLNTEHVEQFEEILLSQSVPTLGNHLKCIHKLSLTLLGLL